AVQGDRHRRRVGTAHELLPLGVELADVDDECRHTEQHPAGEQHRDQGGRRTAVAVRAAQEAACRPYGQARHGITPLPRMSTSSPKPPPAKIPAMAPTGVTKLKR